MLRTDILLRSSFWGSFLNDWAALPPLLSDHNSFMFPLVNIGQDQDDQCRSGHSVFGGLYSGQTMNGSRWAILRHVRLPAALPAFASGLRVATAIAPIGAVVGEWVGSSAGLGYLMLHANGRMQIDLMFAALLTLALFAVALYFTIDAVLRRALLWQADD